MLDETADEGFSGGRAKQGFAKVGLPFWFLVADPWRVVSFDGEECWLWMVVTTMWRFVVAR